jgi:hypothetical protein
LIRVLGLIRGTGIPSINPEAGINPDNFRIAEGRADCRLSGAAGGADGACGTGGP